MYGFLFKFILDYFWKSILKLFYHVYMIPVGRAFHMSIVSQVEE